MDAATEPQPAAAVATTASPTRLPNTLGRIGLILVLLAVAAPIVGFIFVLINGGWPGERLSGELTGFASLSAIFFALMVSAFAAPVAIVGVVLGGVSLTRAGRGKVAGILAIVLGIIPSLCIFNWLLFAALYNPGP